MASIKKNNKGDWRVQINKLGVRDSTTFDSKRAAQNWASIREAEIVSTGGVKCAHKHILVSELFDRYVQNVSIHKGGKNVEEKRLAYFAEHHPSISVLVKSGIKVIDVSKSDIATWRDERLKTVKSSTVLREKNLLCNVFNKAVEWGIILESPFRGLKWPKEAERRERPVSEYEIEKIIFCLDDWDKVSKPETLDHKIAAIFLFAIETAMRQGEIKYLSASEVFIDERVIRLPANRTKERRKKVIGLSKEAMRILNLCRFKDNNWFDIYSVDISSKFKSACRRAGVDNLVFHDSRHEGITRLAEVLNPFELARQVGHKDLSELNTYYEKQADQFAHKLG